MTILARIRANGGEARREDWRLILTRGRLPDAAVAWVKENRDRLMRELWPQYDDWQERAAIREFDGGQARDEAEQDAYAEMMAR